MTRSALPAAAAVLAIAACGEHAEAPGPLALVVAPTTLALTVGAAVDATAQFQRDGAGVAGPDLSWASSDPARATVDGHGLRATITALAVGSATITASGGGLNATIELAITTATLTRIAVAPDAPAVAAGTTRPISVFATYSDLSTADVAAQVAWTSNQPSVASASGAVLTGFVKGETTITAMYMGLTASAPVMVTDPVLRLIDVQPTLPSVVIGTTQQFTATGTFSDGSSTDLTAAAAWASSVPGVATISNAGLASTVAVGTSTISATSGRVTGMATLTVDPIR